MPDNILDRFFFKLYAPLSPVWWIKYTSNGKQKMNRLRKLLSKFGKKLTTIEFGGAEGYISQVLVQEGFIKHATVIDILDHRMNIGKKNIAKLNLQNKISFNRADACNLPYKDNAFDVVMILDILEHIYKKEDVKRALLEAKRVAKKGIIISIPQEDATNFFSKYAKYVELDHLRIHLKYNNGWIYNPNKFTQLLTDCGLRFSRVSRRSGTYVAKS